MALTNKNKMNVETQLEMADSFQILESVNTVKIIICKVI